MKKQIKKLKFYIKTSLLNKLRNQKKLTNYYKARLEEYIVEERKWNDELNRKQVEIRRLSLENKKLKGEL